MRKKYIYIVFTLCFLLTGCHSDHFLDNINRESKKEGVLAALFSPSEIEPLDPQSFLEWCEDTKNGLIINRDFNEFSFTSFNKPVQYIALKELSENEAINENEFTKKQSELGELDYFSFRISCKSFDDELLKYKLNSEQDYYKRIEYFSFKIQDDFELVSGQDTLKPVLFHFERVYGLNSGATFLLAFPNKDFTKEKKIIYTDRVFNNGPVIISYRQNSFHQIPKIKLYEHQN